MFTKAIVKALVIVLTVGMTSLLVQPTSALIQADSLTLSTATYSQAVGETATANSPVVTMSYLGQYMGDTYSVSSWLVSAPAGNTRMPTLRLIETNSALVYNIAGDGPLALGTNFAAGTSAYVSPSVDAYVAVTARFQVYLDAPATAGTYVVRLEPTNKTNGGVKNATALTLTITVGGSSQTQDSTPVYSPPTETSTPDTYTAILNVTNALPTQLTSKNQTTADLFVDFISYATTIGDTSSVTAYLVSAPAGNTSLPVLELTQVTNSRIDKNAKFTEALTPGYKFIGGNSAYMTASPFLGAMAAKFKLYLDNPKKSGTYVVKLQLRTEAGVATAPTKGLIITFTVTRDPETYPVAADVIISHPGDISNKSDAEINVSKGADTTNEVAVIRTTLRSATGAVATLDSYTAVITGPGVLGSAPLSADINTSAIGRAITVRAGDAVTLYADGTSGVATIMILTFDGTEVARKTVNFVDLTNLSSAVLALSFSSFPEKGTPMQLTALVNLPGTVRFTTNGKTLGSCARVTATGLPKTAICQWKPPLAGSINVVARFTPTDSQITPVSTTKVLAIGRRSGRR